MEMVTLYYLDLQKTGSYIEMVQGRGWHGWLLSKDTKNIVHVDLALKYQQE
jgi:hypothetical protein